jgi:ArsR family transcriptional regulator
VTLLIHAFAALSDVWRLRIIGLLDEREVCVSDIYSVLGIHQPTVSKHLGVLRRAGLVEVRRQGLWMYYRIASSADPAVAGLLRVTLNALGRDAVCLADRNKLNRRSATVVIPQAWHGTDPDFLD